MNVLGETLLNVVKPDDYREESRKIIIEVGNFKTSLC